MRKILIAATFIVVSSAFSSVNAQLLSTNYGTETGKNSENKQDWSIFTDLENHMIYVDFEKINVNLSSVAIKDTDNKVLFKDDSLWQLPVNTIYEVDFSKYPKGVYTMELRTFTSSIKRTVTIN